MKKLLAVLMILVLSISIVACTPKEEPAPPIEDPAGNDDEIVDPTPETDSKDVTLYFLNEEYVETGDESLEKLIPEERTIEVGSTTLEESIVKALMNGPESEGIRTAIPSTAKLLGVEVSDGTAFVNFSREGMFGGSLEETYTINQIVASLVELDSVDRVQFLIDGQKGDSLMGHYSIDEPFDDILGE
ncbi:GerMN domain-containing protein [Tissierella sp. Yu-01]|uniref:GerMN domain-containing protein n=1 Tax=Tissierella sp. Yu-01 TaxID=3035694 RepID=UPI00240E84E2|nr:GerMN domain-containing protein [Tissierella sp. Yu-01]WFA08424.1 GerMN domain-containing protein [Tissierella sp. Yu-01]